MLGRSPRKPRPKQDISSRKIDAFVLKWERAIGRHGGLGKYGYRHMKTTLSEVSKVLGIDFDRIVSSAKGTVRILDLGCGEGTALQELRRIFPDPQKVELAGVSLNYCPFWKNKSINWVVAPFYRLPKKLSGKKFDLIYSHFGLENSPDLKRDAKIVRGLLKDNGLLVTTMPRWQQHKEYSEWVQTRLEDFLGKMPGFKLEKYRIHHVDRGKYSYKDDSWILHLRKTKEAEK